MITTKDYKEITKSMYKNIVFGTTATDFFLDLEIDEEEYLVQLTGLKNTHATASLGVESGVKLDGIKFPWKITNTLAAGGIHIFQPTNVAVVKSQLYFSCTGSGAGTTALIYAHVKTFKK